MAGYRKMKKRKRRCRVKNQPRGLARIKLLFSRASRCIAEFFGKKEPQYIPDCYIGSGENKYPSRTVPQGTWRRPPGTPRFFSGFVSRNRGRHWDCSRKD
jgi:hypothetical protein